MFKKTSLGKLSRITLILLALVLMLTACSAPANTNDAGGQGTQAEGTQVESQQEVEVPDQKELPAPIVADCNEDNPYSPKCSSINASNLHEYLGRDDVIYIDLRNYEDYAIKNLKNFEPIPYFGYIYDKAAGTDDEKHQLFGGSTDDPLAVYEESDKILEKLIPKDKNIFFMCASGGRVAGALQLLEQKGYDMDKLYNVGGMNQFSGPEYEEYTTDSSELKLEAVYSFEGLTKTN